MALPLALLVCFFFVGVESSFSQFDRITQLPGHPPVWFQQYSGYVTVDEKKQKALFYYFAEAELDCASKPLVLWLNGGKEIPASIPLIPCKRLEFSVGFWFSICFIVVCRARLLFLGSWGIF